MVSMDFDVLSEAFDSERELRAMKKLLEVRDTRVRFAVEHHCNTRGERMDFAAYPHIRALYNSLAPELALMGSVQSMKSEWAVIDHFAMAFNGLSIFYVLPKFDMRTTYVQNRVNRAVENSPEYKRIVRSGFFDSVALKNFGRGSIKYVGSNVLADFKEFPADVLIVEEVDECDADNVEYALDRLRASHFQFKRYLGNPKLKGRGIHQFYEQSDQREWYVPCLKCGNFHILDWFETVVEAIHDKSGQVLNYVLRDKDWEPGGRRDIQCVCPDCGGPLEHASQRGDWRPTNPGGRMEGYHLSMLCSPINSIAGMWMRFQRALDDPLRLQQFYNSDLGLPYSALGNKVTSELLDDCAEIDGVTPFAFQIDGDGCGHIEGDRHPGPCSMGVDVGGNFDVRISHVHPRGQREAVFIGKVRNNLEELIDLIHRYNVEKVVIDAMPEITLVQDFQDMAPCDVWLCQYAREGKDGRRTYDVRDRIIRADRTEALDRGFAHLRRKINYLPTNYESVLGGSYAKEMCGPVREVVEDDKGNAKYEWSKCTDHQRHADAYDIFASDLVNESIIDDVSFG